MTIWQCINANLSRIRNKKNPQRIIVEGFRIPIKTQLWRCCNSNLGEDGNGTHELRLTAASLVHRAGED